MRSSMRTTVTRRLSPVAFAMALGACATRAEYVVEGTERSIGVDGLITIAPQAEDVNRVKVELEHLPPPERHDRRMRTFVVWLTPPDGATVRAGRLAYDRDSREGRLEATTPNDAVHVQVTAERESDVNAPSDVVVVSRHVVLTRSRTARR
jgi:hypothetical protein